MTTARRIALAAAALGVVLTACGSTAAPSPPTNRTGSPSASASPTALSGTPVTTAQFTTVLPQGWTNRIGDPTEVQKFRVNGEVLFLIEQDPPGQQQANVNDVKANVNVLALTTPVPDNEVPQYLGTVATNGATNLSSPQAFTIDGATGQFITYDRDVKGTPGESQDMIVNHGGNTYDIILNTSQFAFNQQSSGLQAVLAAWKWTT